MAALILSAKAALAAVLLVAGGAKLAAPAGFAQTVRLFAPRLAQVAAGRAIAIAIAVIELLLGALSLAWPAIWPANVAAFALCCAFVVVSAVGYLRFAGHTCRCFGVLFRKKFDRAGVVRSSALLIVSVIAMLPVRSTAVQVGTVSAVLLLAGASVLAAAAFTAARALDAGQTVLTTTGPNHHWAG